MFSWGKQANKEPEWAYEDLPSPETTQDMMKVIEDEKHTRLAWINGIDGWSHFANHEGIDIDQLQLPNSPIHVVRAVGVLKNVDVHKMFESFANGGLEERQKVSPDILQHEVIEKVNGDETTYLSYSRFKTPMGISNRDFLTLRSQLHLDDGSTLIVSQSVNSKKKPFDSATVRGVTRNARLFEPISDTECKVTLVDHVDPKGHVPAFVINLFKKKAAEAIVKLQNIYGPQ
mmetsp:Transcript_32165/g.54975  ORF Transcript_32165/g.54975 Transcript_32165/m.54975 type:complete len:231 (-) Transcript_32165:57-749(-)